ncbi:coiled-coil domain-containing protein 66 [Limanda limanda]|uniref:coiled-coil domain-containing protein 66 n=1 Tax=Limanda limanda TaxID=27771 RepID=UPI0029C9A7BA|nr:coiled-coil domain-containing protein 66 [Limanda limanda]
MNLGDGLLFELENGKPRLILLSNGVEKNPNKLLRPRVTKVLSSRQPSCLEEVQGEERPARQQPGRYRETRSRAAGAATSSLNSHTSTTRERSTALTSSKTHEHLNQGGIKAAAKVKSDRHKQSSTVASPRANGKPGKPQKSEARAGGKAGLKEAPASGGAGPRDNMVVLTREQLQQLLNTIKSQQPPEDHRTQGSQSGTSVNEGEMMEEDRGGGEVVKKGEGGGGVTDTTGSSQDKDNRTSASLLSWTGGRQSDNRSVIGTKKAQWRRELDEQLVLKAQQQQRWAPARIQAEEDAERVLSVQSSLGHREQPAAIRSSLKLGEVTPMAQVLSGGRREEEKRQWLEELNRQREDATERKRREKLIQNQTVDHELWAVHFDSLQQRPPVRTAAPSAPSAPPPAPSSRSERGDWEPSSSLSLVWEATSSCGAESVGGASVDTTSGYQSRASHVRTMTALLDPAEIEERERKRFKQLEQQRAIEAQMQEQRQQREREEARRREEEEKEARRLLQEREKMQRQYELDRLRERQKVQEKSSLQAEPPRKGHSEERSQETLQPSVTTRAEHLKEDVKSSVPPFKDTAVQTEAVPALSLGAEVQTPDVSAHYQPAPFVSAAPPPNSKNPGVRTGKENICLPGGGGRGGGGGGDPYETFARTERSRTDKRRPDWNTQRPSRRFVPASERYPAALQRDRQESRLKRQAELVALQGRTCLSRTEPAPPPPPAPPPHQDPRPSSNTQTRAAPHSKVGGPIVSAAASNERGRSPPVPAVRHRVQSQQSSNHLPPPVLDFIPYNRTDEITLEPLEPPEIPPPHTVSPRSSVSPPAPPHQDHAHTTRQQEILKSLAQLRQGLLQKQRELESDLNPLLKHHSNELRSHSAMHHK